VTAQKPPIKWTGEGEGGGGGGKGCDLEVLRSRCLHASGGLFTCIRRSVYTRYLEQLLVARAPPPIAPVLQSV
jgi:hypothetical protein